MVKQQAESYDLNVRNAKKRLLGKGNIAKEIMRNIGFIFG